MEAFQANQPTAKFKLSCAPSTLSIQISGKRFKARLLQPKLEDITQLLTETNIYTFTTVLGKTKSAKDVEKLEKWKKKLGHEAAAKEMTRAANRGTALHKICEDFLEYPGQEFDRPWDKSIKLFKQIHPLLSRIGEVHVIEGVLYSDILKVAGRCDLVATWDGKVSIIDFKGSTKPKEPEWINDYFLQETFYGVAYGALYAPCKVEQIVTVIAVEQTGENQVFIRNPQDYVLQLFNRIKTISCTIKLRSTRIYIGSWLYKLYCMVVYFYTN